MKHKTNWPLAFFNWSVFSDHVPSKTFFLSFSSFWTNNSTNTPNPKGTKSCQIVEENSIDEITKHFFFIDVHSVEMAIGHVNSGSPWLDLKKVQADSPHGSDQTPFRGVSPTHVPRRATQICPLKKKFNVFGS